MVTILLNENYFDDILDDLICLLTFHFEIKFIIIVHPFSNSKQIGSRGEDWTKIFYRVCKILLIVKGVIFLRG